jgi:hypothetical protein
VEAVEVSTFFCPAPITGSGLEKEKKLVPD